MNKIVHVHSSKTAPKKETIIQAPRKDATHIESTLIPIISTIIPKKTRIDAFGNLISSGSRNHKVSFKDRVTTDNLVDISTISTERKHKICCTSRNYKYDSPKLYSMFLNQKLNSFIEQSENRDESIFRIETDESDTSQSRKKKRTEDNKCGKCILF